MLGIALEVVGLALSLSVAVWKVISDTRVPVRTRWIITILVVLGTAVALGSAVNRQIGATKAHETAQELYAQIDRLEEKLDDIQRAIDAMTQQQPVLLTSAEFSRVTENVKSIRTTVVELQAGRDRKLFPLRPGR